VSWKKYLDFEEKDLDEKMKSNMKRPGSKEKT